MRNRHKLLLASALLGAGTGVLLAGLSVSAVEAAQPDCQTVVTCRFTKGGTYRGCLSSYTCRRCTFIAARCQIGNTEGACRKVRCTWGG
jgi:hypothetical protein